MIASKSLASFASTIQLYTEPNSRRLFKARHQEMDKMVIYTQATADPSTRQILGQRISTVYTFHIRNGATKEATDPWVLARRYSEFAHFRTELLTLIRQWEETAELEGGHKLESREFELVSNLLRRPIAPHFPRKHVRGDNSAIVEERRRGLRGFVRKLLDAYADISVYLYNNSMRTDNSCFRTLQNIYTKLETFLQVPETHKELERRHMAAVLALEDVPVVDEGNETQEHNSCTKEHPDRTCCICLDDYECDDSSAAVLDAAFFAGENSAALGRDKLVKLPCGHHYHEDCVLEWFNTSITCPLCRVAVVTDEPSSFDVSMC